MAKQRTNVTSTLLVVAALVLGGLGFYFNRPGAAPTNPVAVTRENATDGTSARGLRARGEPRVEHQLRISPEKVDLGTISQCKTIEPLELVLTNDGAQPVTIVGWIATCSCVVPELAAGAVIEPGSFLKVTVHVHPLGLGGKSQRLDFRLDGNARGASVRIDYRIESAILPMPVMVVRPDSFDTKVVDLERIDVDGNFIAEKFAIRGIEPMVAHFIDSTGDGRAAIEVDFKAIDAVAEASDGRDSKFEWETRGGKRRWKSLELTVETDCPACERLRIRIRNR
jgi:hypothetical protein